MTRHKYFRTSADRNQYSHHTVKNEKPSLKQGQESPFTSNAKIPEITQSYEITTTHFRVGDRSE
jgi:hypothetical protein